MTAMSNIQRQNGVSQFSGAQKGKEPFLFPESFPFLRKGKGKLSVLSGLEREWKGDFQKGLNSSFSEGVPCPLQP